MLVELAVGDAYGAGFEYVDPSLVRRHNDLSGYFKHPRHRIKLGCYTDDTQMSLGIAEMIVEDVPWTREAIAAKFVDVFKRDPREGYAGRFYKFLKQVRDGREFLANIRPASDKSGAAMRAAPLGAFSTIEEVIQRSETQARITHDTPDGIAAAAAAALMAHYFIYELGSKDDVGRFLEEHVPGKWSEAWRGQVGAKGWMSVRAAITAVRQNDKMSSLLRRCVSFCGDVDTVATIALSAAAHSSEIEQDLPDHLIKGLENGTYGRDYLAKIDKQLMATVRKKHGGDSFTLELCRQRLGQIEGQLAGQAFIHFHTFERDGRKLHVAITNRLRKKCRKKGVWKSKEMLITLKNAAYGLDETMACSSGGRDGIFLLDRDHRPANAMMKKMFDQFLDKPDSGVREIADVLQTSVDQLQAARLVSHHLRLLGVLHRTDGDWLVLVDCDRTK